MGRDLSMPDRCVFALLFLLCWSAFAQSSATVVGSGYVDPQLRVAPGQVVTVYLSGLKTVLPQPRSANAAGVSLPTVLAGISATITQSVPNIPLSVPLFSINQINMCSDPTAASPDCLLTAATVQIPYEIMLPSPRGAGVLSEPIGATQLVFYENGMPSKSFSLGPAGSNTHVLTNCTAYRTDNYGGTQCTPLVTHADGRLVFGPVTNLYEGSGPAKPGEELVMYAVGLGGSVPAVKTGQPTPSPAPSIDGVTIGYDFSPNAAPKYPLPSLNPPGASATPVFAGLTPGFVGLYQINFVVPTPPPGTRPCLAIDGLVTSNLTVSVAAGGSFDGAGICVHIDGNN